MKIIFFQNIFYVGSTIHKLVLETVKVPKPSLIPTYKPPKTSRWTGQLLKIRTKILKKKRKKQKFHFGLGLILVQLSRSPRGLWRLIGRY